jgi:hypothetical protein
MNQALERIIEDIKTLSKAERRQLAAHLQGIDGSAPAASAEGELEEKLAAEGWLSLPEPPSPDSPPFELGSPLTVAGRPLSEVLIEERR